MAKPAKNEKTPETDAPESEAAPAVKESAAERKLRTQLAEALTLIEALKAELKQPPTPGKKKPLALPEKYKGTKRYKVVKGPIYRKGLLEVGSIISLTNEIPSANLIEVDNAGKPVSLDEDTE